MVLNLSFLAPYWRLSIWFSNILNIYTFFQNLAPSYWRLSIWFSNILYIYTFYIFQNREKSLDDSVVSVEAGLDDSIASNAGLDDSIASTAGLDDSIASAESTAESMDISQNQPTVRMR